MGRMLVEYDTGDVFGPCSEENLKLWETASAAGYGFFLYPYHGYHLRMRVESVEEAKSRTENPQK